MLVKHYYTILVVKIKPKIVVLDQFGSKQNQHHNLQGTQQDSSPKREYLPHWLLLSIVRLYS